MILVALLLQVSFAAFNNENSLLIGDQAAGMGGAATAVVGDSAGAPYYNPGTLAFMQGSAFSAAVGIYKKFDFVYGQSEDFTKAPLRINQGFFRSLPASTGSILRWKQLPDLTFALSVVVPDYEQFKGDLKNDDKNISSLTYTDESLWVGGAVSKKISTTEAVGFTLYYTARSYANAINDRSYISSTESKLFYQEKILTENSLIAHIGYYKQMAHNFGFGATLRTPAWRIAGRGSIFQTYTEATAGSVSTTNVSQPELAAAAKIPAKLTLGFSWRIDDTLLLSSDLSFREAISFYELENKTYASQIRHQAVANAALGLEKTFVDWFKARIGAYTNLSSQPNPDTSLNFAQEDRVDMLGFSANLVYTAESKISYTFGGYYTGGKGRSLQRIDQKPQVIPKTTHIFTMLLGTSFAF